MVKSTANILNILDSFVDVFILSVLHPKTRMTMQKFKQITLQLEQDTLDRLKVQAHREGDRPVASLIREILQGEISVKAIEDQDLKG